MYRMYSTLEEIERICSTDCKITNPEYFTKFLALRDEGKIKTKAIFLDYLDFADIVVESFKFDGKFYMFIAQVDNHREEVRWQDLWVFSSADKANEFFKKRIKDPEGFFDYLSSNSNEAYADMMLRACGTLD